MSLYSHMQMPLFHVNTRLAFPTGVAPNGRFFVYPNLTTMSSGMQFSATRKFRRTDAPPPSPPPSSRFPIISCFYFIRESLQKQWPSFFQNVLHASAEYIGISIGNKNMFMSAAGRAARIVELTGSLSLPEFSNLWRSRTQR